MYCPYCGYDLKDGSIFCSNCGEKIEEPQKQVPYIDPSENGSKPRSFSGKQSTQTSNQEYYQQPYQESYGQSEQGPKYSSPSSIIDEVDDLQQSSDKPDRFPLSYYLLSLIFWPMGIVFWALEKEQKPESAQKILLTGLMSLVLFIALFINSLG